MTATATPPPPTAAPSADLRLATSLEPDHRLEARVAAYERVPTSVFADSAAASRAVAAEIAAVMRQKADAGETCVLGLATGSTPTSVYDELIRLHTDEGLSFSNVVTFNLDE